MKVTICGSIAFYDKMLDVKNKLEALGHEVKLPPHEIEDDSGAMIPVREYYALRKATNTEDDWIWDRKAEAITNHFDKVQWADVILVTNYDKNNITGYIGGNTLMEMGVAFFLKKPIYLLKGLPEISYKEEILGMKAEKLLQKIARCYVSNAVELKQKNKTMTTYARYQNVIKPSWAPAEWIFRPVWIVLYILIAISFGAVFHKTVSGELPFIVALPFILNLIFNFAFVPIQFKFKNNYLATVDILLALGTLIWALLAIWGSGLTRHIEAGAPTYAWIIYANIPYLLWVSFAAILQVSITYLNRQKRISKNTTL